MIPIVCSNPGRLIATCAFHVEQNSLTKQESESGGRAPGTSRTLHVLMLFPRDPAAAMGRSFGHPHPLKKGIGGGGDPWKSISGSIFPFVGKTRSMELGPLPTAGGMFGLPAILLPSGQGDYTTLTALVEAGKSEGETPGARQGRYPRLAGRRLSGGATS